MGHLEFTERKKVLFPVSLWTWRPGWKEPPSVSVSLSLHPVAQDYTCFCSLQMRLKGFHANHFSAVGFSWGRPASVQKCPSIALPDTSYKVQIEMLETRNCNIQVWTSVNADPLSLSQPFSLSLPFVPVAACFFFVAYTDKDLFKYKLHPA